MGILQILLKNASDPVIGSEKWWWLFNLSHLLLQAGGLYTLDPSDPSAAFYIKYVDSGCLRVERNMTGCRIESLSCKIFNLNGH